MAEGDSEATFTQADVDAAIAEANKGLEANRNDVLEDLRKAKDALKVYDGLNVSEARAAMTKLKEIEQDADAGDKGISTEVLNTIRAENRQSLEEEFLPFRTENDVLKKENRELKLDNVVKAKMGANGVKANRIDALFRLSSADFDLTEEGDPMLAGHPGQDVDKHITDVLYKQYPEFYESSGSSGGGASKSDASGTGRVKTIMSSDKQAMSANIEGIANGTVLVVNG